MANEATQLTLDQTGTSWVDNTPTAFVSTGYQAQNTTHEAVYNGIDSTTVEIASATQITIPIGGVVDVDGILYAITVAATLALPASDTNYYIHLTGVSPGPFTLALSTSAGTYDPVKKARYSGSGERILDWIVRRDSTATYASKVVDSENLVAVEQSVRRSSIVTLLELLTKSGLSESRLYTAAGGALLTQKDSSGAQGTIIRSYSSLGLQAEFLAGGIQTAGDLILGGGGLFQDTSDGADNKIITIGGGGSDLRSRGAVFAAFGNEFVSPGVARIFAGTVANSRVEIYTGDDGSESKAVNIDDADGFTLNRPFLPTTTPTTGSQVVTDGAPYVLPRGRWNISFPTTGSDVNLQIQVAGTWYRVVRQRSVDDSASHGSGIDSDGTNVRISVGVGQPNYTFFYQKY